MMRPLIAVLLLAANASAAPVPKELKKSGSLDGLWEITAMEAFGQPRVALKQRWRIAGDTITVEQIVPNGAPRIRPHIAIKVDATTRPKSLDYNTGKIALRLAIYEVDGDTLKILMAMTRKAERPKEMKPDETMTMYTFKRVKE